MRDECEHGSLRRSCTVCDLLDDVRDLEQGRDELKARCERMREVFGADIYGTSAHWEAMKNAIAEPPAVSLARVRAEVLEELSKQPKRWEPGELFAEAQRIRQSATQPGDSND